MNEPDLVFVETRRHRVLYAIPLAQVVHLAATDKYVTVHSTQGQVLIEPSLVQLQRDGLEGFFQCHRAHLVRLDLITRVMRAQGSDYLLELAGYAERVPVSRRLYRALLKLRPELNCSVSRHAALPAKETPDE